MEIYILKGHFQKIQASGTVFDSVYGIALDCLSLVLYVNLLNTFLGFFSVTVEFLFRCSGSAAKQKPRR